MASYSPVWWNATVPNKELSVQVDVAAIQISATTDRCHLNKAWGLELTL